LNRIHETAGSAKCTDLELHPHKKGLKTDFDLPGDFLADVTTPVLTMSDISRK